MRAKSVEGMLKELCCLETEEECFFLTYNSPCERWEVEDTMAERAGIGRLFWRATTAKAVLRKAFKAQQIKLRGGE